MIEIKQLGRETSYYFDATTPIEALLKMQYTLNIAVRQNFVIQMLNGGHALYIEDKYGEVYYCLI